MAFVGPNIPHDNEPNLFWLADEDTRLIYSRTSPTGEPQFYYQDEQHKLTRTGEEIYSLKVEEIGEMVTIEVENIPDFRRVMFTLLLPEIALNDGWEEMPFSTQAILTTHQTSIVGPGQLEGAKQTYRCLSLAGTAKIVQSFSPGGGEAR